MDEETSLPTVAELLKNRQTSVPLLVPWPISAPASLAHIEGDAAPTSVTPPAAPQPAQTSASK